MALLSVQEITKAGVSSTLTAATSQDEFPNTGREYIEVSNGGAAAITVTVVASGKYKGQSFANVTVNVAAGGRVKIGPFEPEIFNVVSGASAGRVLVQFSATTSVTVGVFRLP